MSTPRRNVLKMIAATPLIAGGVKVAADVADQALIELGLQFDVAAATERDALFTARETGDWDAWDVAYERSGAIVDQIEAMPATTMEGLRVKARCVQWCYGDEPVEFGEHRTTDVRLAKQIVETLLKTSNPAAPAA